MDKFILNLHWRHTGHLEQIHRGNSKYSRNFKYWREKASTGSRTKGKYKVGSHIVYPFQKESKHVMYLIPDHRGARYVLVQEDSI